MPSCSFGDGVEEMPCVYQRVCLLVGEKRKGFLDVLDACPDCRLASVGAANGMMSSPVCISCYHDEAIDLVTSSHGDVDVVMVICADGEGAMGVDCGLL